MNELLASKYTHDELVNMLPHGKELVLIEKVLLLTNSSVRCLSKIPLLASFVPDDNGFVSSFVTIEIIAQVASIGKSIDWEENDSNKVKPKSGMVVKLRDFSFTEPVIDSKRPLICEASWTNSNLSIFDVKGKVFYEDDPEITLAEGSLLLVT